LQLCLGDRDKKIQERIRNERKKKINKGMKNEIKN
jgi:hypothetical protein